MLGVLYDLIEDINSFRLTHHVLLCAKLHVSVFGDHHQALFFNQSIFRIDSKKGLMVTKDRNM